jgi:hypothetical protein
MRPRPWPCRAPLLFAAAVACNAAAVTVSQAPATGLISDGDQWVIQSGVDACPAAVAGHSVLHSSTATLEECQAQCEANASCMVFTWNEVRTAVVPWDKWPSGRPAAAVNERARGCCKAVPVVAVGRHRRSGNALPVRCMHPLATHQVVVVAPSSGVCAHLSAHRNGTMPNIVSVHARLLTCAHRRSRRTTASGASTPSTSPRIMATVRPDAWRLARAPPAAVWAAPPPP